MIFPFFPSKPPPEFGDFTVGAGIPSCYRCPTGRRSSTRGSLLRLGWTETRVGFKELGKHWRSGEQEISVISGSKPPWQTSEGGVVHLTSFNCFSMLFYHDSKPIRLFKCQSLEMYSKPVFMLELSRILSAITAPLVASRDTFLRRRQCGLAEVIRGTWCWVCLTLMGEKMKSRGYHHTPYYDYGCCHDCYCYYYYCYHYSSLSLLDGHLGHIPIFKHPILRRPTEWPRKKSLGFLMASLWITADSELCHMDMDEN
jgi:hypothetical protein